MSIQMATTVSARLDDDLEARFEAYRNRFKYPPEKSEVVREALEEYFDDRDVDVRDVDADA